MNKSSELYALRDKWLDIYGKAAYDLRDTVNVRALMSRTIAIKYAYWSLRAQVEWEYDTKKLDSYVARTEKLISDVAMLTADQNTYAKNVIGKCATPCKYYARVQMKDCSCAASVPINKLIQTRSSFSGVDQKIYDYEYNGKCHRDQLDEFKTRSTEIREEIRKFNQFFVDNGVVCDATCVANTDQKNVDIKKLTDDLSLEYDTRIKGCSATTAAPACDGTKLTCASNQVKNLNVAVCACRTVNGYNKVVTVEQGLPGLLTDINKLNGQVKDDLSSNWNITNEKLKELRNDVVNSAKNLDLNYV